MKTAELNEAAEIISSLMAYGNIHTVKGVSYVQGTHKEFIDRAERWLRHYRKYD